MEGKSISKRDVGADFNDGSQGAMSSTYVADNSRCCGGWKSIVPSRVAVSIYNGSNKAERIKENLKKVGCSVNQMAHKLKSPRYLKRAT